MKLIHTSRIHGRVCALAGNQRSKRSGHRVARNLLVLLFVYHACVAGAGESLKEMLPENRHAAAEFLIANMPDRDRETLTTAFLKENIDYAYRARETFPWAKSVSEDMFFNYVLPYANLNERRDPWRKKFFEGLGEIVAECETAGEAAIKLNTTLYGRLSVRYSKTRPKACQSAAESIKAGKASCTGLSILLVNACRAVGIPARVVGTPCWVKSGGNHTWAEVWDDGWHSMGASESRALDSTWFGKKASGQIKGDLMHAIYAVSFKKTPLHFPMVWSMHDQSVSAIDVTERYMRREAAATSLEGVKKVLTGNTLAGLLTELSKQDMPILHADVEAVTELVWQKHMEEVRSNPTRIDEHKSRAITYDGMTMRYAYTRIGERPESGYPLYIALHGGGGAPAQVNHSQWEHMQIYYRNGVTNGIYLAPRGVNNEWNLHWRNQSFVCYDRIIENMIVYEGVDPDRVYLVGFSAGGDAAYQIPARMPDRWAGAAMSAGHPNGVSPVNYANLAFLIQVGEHDSAYNRNRIAAEYGVKLNMLRENHPGLYEHATYIHADRGHGFMDHGREGTQQRVFNDPSTRMGSRHTAVDIDCHSIRWLDKHVRTPLPRKIVWDYATRCDRSGDKEPGFWPTTEKGRLHYWLGLDRHDKDIELDAKTLEVEAVCEENRIHVNDIGNYVRFYLSPKMFDLQKNVAVKIDGTTLKAKAKPSLGVVVQTMLDRGDPSYVFPAFLTLSRNPEGTWMLE